MLEESKEQYYAFKKEADDNFDGLVDDITAYVADLEERSIIQGNEIQTLEEHKVKLLNNCNRLIELIFNMNGMIPTDLYDSVKSYCKE